MKDLSQKLQNNCPDHINNINILQAKHKLYDICISKLVQILGGVD